jgi:hypothetical protein
MNPSTATGTVDDRTIRREIMFTAFLEYTSYKKCNVMDYRTTYPKDLLRKGVVPCRPINLAIIQDAAREAKMIVAAWGKLPVKLKHYADAVEKAIFELDRPIHCLGTTQEGFPRHPLYVENGTPFQLYLPRL